MKIQGVCLIVELGILAARRRTAAMSRKAPIIMQYAAVQLGFRVLRLNRHPVYGYLL
jgi:hypothetical protein